MSPRRVILKAITRLITSNVCAESDTENANVAQNKEVSHVLARLSSTFDYETKMLLHVCTIPTLNKSVFYIILSNLT